jgi:hypothetical protein
VGYYILNIAIYSHKLDYKNTPNTYLWLFKDSTKKDIDVSSRFSYIGEKDFYNHYIYKKSYYITIWEFKDMKLEDLKTLSFNRDLALEDSKISFGETINVHSSPEITMQYGFVFYNSMNVNLNDDSKIDSTFQSTNYKGFYGVVNQRLSTNNEGKPCVLFNYANEKQYGVVIWYKDHGSFYLLVINSDKPFNSQKLIRIFNLS